MSIWTVKPSVKTVALVYTDAAGVPHPFEITMKRRLTIGEQRSISTAGWQGMRGTQERGTDAAEARIDIDWQRQTFARTVAYLVDWTLKEEDGTRLPLEPDVIRSLEQDVFTLIEDAITKHVDEMAEEKKAQSSSSKQTPTSA